MRYENVKENDRENVASNFSIFLANGLFYTSKSSPNWPLLLLGKITPMYHDFYFNYKFDIRFWEMQCDTLTFEKMYTEIPSPPKNLKIPLMFLGKLHLCTLTFTLITNLTPGFRKYSAIPSHLK